MWKIAILICMVNAAVIEGNSLYRKGKYGFWILTNVVHCVLTYSDLLHIPKKEILENSEYT